jgi:hypothetical protein
MRKRINKSLRAAWSETVWEGVVESFALTGHAKAKRCYAWTYQDNGETQYINVLEIPPVDSAQKAVQVQIVKDVKNVNRSI